jgi:carbonic anhydrase/acetyltransferase-like protein (isoleucine patch superfamily)
LKIGISDLFFRHPMIYELDDRKPVLEGDNFVAPNAAVIGSVLMKRGANVWWGCTLRGDNELITLGENVNVQDGSVIHTDLGIPVVLERNVSVGHMVMLHGCTIGENSLIGIGAIILNRAVVGKNCLIGAGALVPEGKAHPDGSLAGRARQGRAPPLPRTSPTTPGSRSTTSSAPGPTAKGLKPVG